MHNFIRTRIQTPDFWPASEAEIDAMFDAVSCGEVIEYGRSVTGRPLRLVHTDNPGAEVLWVMAGAHGHEPGGVAACFNLLQIMATGEDLRGRPWPEIAAFADDLEIVVVPCQNIDARLRSPDGFVGLPRSAVVTIGQGIDSEGRTMDKEAGLPDGLDLDEVSFIGTLYNEAGFSFNRAYDYDTTPVVEVQQMLEVMPQFSPDCCVDLHACGFNVMMMVRSLPEPSREKVRRIDAAARDAVRALGHEYSDTLPGSEAPPDTGVFSHLRIIHKHHGGLAFVYEGRQGFLDQLPRCDYDDIIDDYLTTIRETMRLGVQEGFRPE